MLCVSAPGKVLLTGGFLVLDAAYTGLVVGTDARFRTRVLPDRAGSGAVRVESPQFGWAQTYAVDVTSESGVTLLTRRDVSAGANPYVETTLRNVVAYAVGVRGAAAVTAVLEKGVTLEVCGANDFYSQRAELLRRGLPLSHAALAALPPYCVAPDASPQTVKKTGLGSSAALITSLTGALLVHLGVVSAALTDLGDRATVHNVAQFCHCLAQGKIGSGFDVSAAVYGSHRYRRFTPAVLEGVLRLGNNVSSAALLEALAPSAPWDADVAPFRLPAGVELVLGDVAVGSSTPTMVSKVLAWRSAHADEAQRLWTQLSEVNGRVEQLLREGGDALHSDLPEAFRSVRALMREMGERSDVPIEPPEQTRLLDAVMALPGVLMAGVPGAGGYDAVFALVTSKKARDCVFELWAGWTEMSVCPLLAQESSAGITVEFL